MKTAWVKLLGVAVVLILVAGVYAADKEETLKGMITCAKCDLKKEKACHTVIVVKDKDNKDVVYYFDADGSKKYHKPICQESKKGSAVGVVSEKDGKKIITVSKVEFDK